VSQRQVQCDKAAGAVPEDDGVLDAQQPAQRGDVVGHLLERAGAQRGPCRATPAAQVDEHELRGVGQRAQRGPQVAVVEPGATGEYDERRASVDAGSVEVELAAFDVEVQLGVVDRHTHCFNGGSWWKGRRRR
jgi:hypothetical protein